MASTINADNGVVSGSAGLKESADSSGILALQTNGTTAVTVDASQNVGIGTSSPSGKLNVISGSVAQLIIGFSGTSASYLDSDLIVFRSAATSERMRIDSSGNVLIGTTTAQTGAVLAVTGGIQGTIKSGTAVASTSGTSIDFTALPAWVKKITVMFNAVSLNGISTFRIQLGTGSTTYTTSGYVTFGITFGASTLGAATDTGGFPIGLNQTAGGTTTYGGSCVITNVSGNIWSYMAVCGGSSVTNGGLLGGGSVSLGAALTAVRITTINGTDTFDAGSINILYEG